MLAYYLDKKKKKKIKIIGCQVLSPKMEGVNCLGQLKPPEEL